MNRGVAALALCIIGVAASGISSAAGAEFHSEVETSKLTGVAEQATVIDNVGGATLSCPAGTSVSTVASNTTEEITADYNFTPGIIPVKCDFLFFKVFVKTNTCYFIFHADGSVDITGATCSGISWEGAGCTITLAKRLGAKGVTYTNKGSGTTQEITVDTNPIAGLAGNATGWCPKTGLFNSATMSGALLLTGEVFGTSTHTGIWWA